ncbi:MAG: MoxR family ATPase [Acidobacteriota bacterium]|nr:MAG: MoxR family ATPase [Acidobacteriota bacterium]
MNARDSVLELKDRVSRSIIGQEHIIERLLIGLLANGNLLVEGLPGLAKTRAVKSVSEHLKADFSRIQFTPDLLPSDVTGTEVYHQVDGRGEFRFEAGPIFANIVLADEINRAPAKVQAALLEAMEERQVTVAKKTHKLPELFLVMATQNPIEQEGTYPLPEAQMDRFLIHVLIGYPDEAAEAKIVRLVRGEEAAASKKKNAGSGEDSAPPAEAPISQNAILAARAEIHAVHVAEAVEKYIVDLVFATRYPDRYGEPLSKWVQVGASPRGAIGLDRCARAHAWLHGRDHVTPDDVRAIAHDVLRHRLILSYEANAAGVTPNKVIDELVKLVAVA